MVSALQNEAIKLSVYSQKVFERLLEKQMAPFMGPKLANSICRFKDSHSTQHALLRVIETIRLHINQSGLCGMVLMDLSQAHDCLPQDLLLAKIEAYCLCQTLSTFHYILLDKCRALLSVVQRGWPNALDFSLDLELNSPQMYYLMNNSFTECFVYYLMNSNCTCVRSTTLDNFCA